jgi:hypothetical protein
MKKNSIKTAESKKVDNDQDNSMPEEEECGRLSLGACPSIVRSTSQYFRS